MRLWIVVAVAVYGIATPAAARAARYPGTFAFIGGKAAVRATLVTASTRDPLRAGLDLAQMPLGSSRVLRDYQTDATKKLHLIVVSDDFRTFLHVHPALAGDGHFRYQLAVPRRGRYYLYADSTPQGRSRQVFRFTVPFGHAGLVAASPVLPPRGDSARAGPYTVRLSQTALGAGVTSHVRALVTERGRPALDLHAYLGNAAHIVLLDVTSLAYAHVHPMYDSSTMDDMPKGDDMAGMSADLAENAPVKADWALHIGPLAAGTYVAWVQFRGGAKLYVAPFVLTVK